MKTCTKCKAQKPLTEFSKDSRGVMGRRSHCKGCVNQRMAVYYAENREELAMRARSYRMRHPEKIRVSDREKYLASRDRNLARQKEWYLRNKEASAITGERNRLKSLAETQAVATRAGAPWEEGEETSIMDYSKTSKEWALILGRSYEAVRGRRRVITKRFMNTN